MALSTFTGLKTVANGYVAFGGDGTFGKHWDTHDVFAVQLLGRKQWQVPIFDEILEAGDVLYIPRGWWHRAIPLENQETFHIAAGVHTAKVTDFVAWIVEQLLPEHIESRRSITPYSDHQKHISECLAMLNRVISDPVNMQMFIDKMQALNNVYEPVDFNSYKPRTSGSAQSLAFSMLRNSLIAGWSDYVDQTGTQPLNVDYLSSLSIVAGTLSANPWVGVLTNTLMKAGGDWILSAREAKSITRRNFKTQYFGLKL
eukprot:gene25857-28165_t